MAITSITNLAPIINEAYGQRSVENIIAPGFVGDMLDPNSLLGFMKAKGLVKVENEGQHAAKRTIHYGGGTAAAFGVGDPIPSAAQEQREEATWNWKRYWISVEVDRLALNAIQGAATIDNIIDLMMNEIDAKTKQLLSLIEQHIWAGTGGNELEGLSVAVDDAGTYAGLDRTSRTWWRAVDVDRGGADINITSDLRLVRETLKNRTAPIDLCVASPTQVNKYKAALTAGGTGQIQYDTERVGDSEIRVLRFDGLPILEVPGFTNTTWNFLSTSQMKLKFLSQKDVLAREGANAIGSQATTAHGMPVAFVPHPAGADAYLGTLVAYVGFCVEDPNKTGRASNLGT